MPSAPPGRGPALPGRRLLTGLLLSGLLLSGCAPDDSTDGVRQDDVYVETEPIAAVSIQAEPEGPVSLHTGPPEVVFSWTGLRNGEPVTHSECVGMVALTSPDGRVITLDPSITECAGRTELVLDQARGTAGDYRINVMLNGLNTTLFYSVVP